MSEIAHYYFNWAIITEVLPMLLAGFGMTLLLSLFIIVLGLSLGFALALARAYQLSAVNFLIIVFVDVFRALPPLVILVFAYFGLPYAGLSITPFWCVVLTLGLVLAALAEEIFWAGLIGVPQGQWDASLASGLSFGQALVLVIAAQGVRFVIPPLTNKVISITKSTALASVVAVPELLNQAITSQGVHANPSPLTAAALLFIAVFLPLVRLASHLEKRYGFEG